MFYIVKIGDILEMDTDWEKVSIKKLKELKKIIKKY